MIKENDITCTACNVMDIGTIIQESDTLAHMRLSGENMDNLQQTLTDLAREVENEPCEIKVIELDNGEREMVFDFSCAAEKLIFEMRARRFM